MKATNTQPEKEGSSSTTSKLYFKTTAFEPQPAHLFCTPGK